MCSVHDCEQKKNANWNRINRVQAEILVTNENEQTKIVEKQKKSNRKI